MFELATPSVLLPESTGARQMLPDTKLPFKCSSHLSAWLRSRIIKDEQNVYLCLS